MQRRHASSRADANDFAVRNLSQIAETAQAAAGSWPLLARCVDLAARGRHRDHEHPAGLGHRADARDRFRMAIGARRLHVLLQFLAEAVLSVSAAASPGSSSASLVRDLSGVAGWPHRPRPPPFQAVPVLGRRRNLLRLLPGAESRASRSDRGAALMSSATRQKSNEQR